MTGTTTPHTPARRTRLNTIIRMVVAPVPLVMIMAGSVLANRYRPMVLGMPFFVFWTVVSVCMCSVSMGVIYLLDPANHGHDGDDAP
ncbi:DUF3311 domain-containing protein [Komagataeibacter saccharivorans]|uniref:DUF3311 domain-containing protein n=1 Tax=Komagataeibacter saccharivorans TaxID=265959 RepID=UPI0010C51275|nr:DUF3311 domain-containing protein [Komagataeibacter saccharivorans]QBL93803.1 hypothetical protein KSAC_15790 [Komagataeibacter saccharivorans]